MHIHILSVPRGARGIRVSYHSSSQEAEDDHEDKRLTSLPNMGSFPDRKQESKILMLSKGTYNMYFHSQRAHKSTAVKKNHPKTMHLSAFQSGRIQSCSENSLWSVSTECGCRRLPSDSHGCFLAREGNVSKADMSRASPEAVTCTHGKEKDSAKQSQQNKTNKQKPPIPCNRW